MSNTDGFGTVRVSQITGASLRQLTYWAKEGRILPSVHAPGTGYRHSYSWEDVVTIGVVVALRNAGVELEAACRVGRLVAATGEVVHVTTAGDRATKDDVISLRVDPRPIIDELLREASVLAVA